jgi:hypothetical protein
MSVSRAECACCGPGSLDALDFDPTGIEAVLCVDCIEDCVDGPSGHVQGRPPEGATS